MWSKLYNGDCLEVMDSLIQQGIKVDAIIADIPYGTTACKWDNVIPFEQMWECLHKLIKNNGAIVLFGSEPFSSALRMSNIKEYKYDWYYIKNRPSNFLMSKKQPLRYVENIIVFCNKTCVYNPIMNVGNKNHKTGNNCKRKEGGQFEKIKLIENTSCLKYPKNYLFFDRPHPPIHPTQKPVALMEYFIKTYSSEGEIILDFTMGSGTTGVACKNTNRNFIGIELDEKYFNIAKDRIEGVERLYIPIHNDYKTNLLDFI